MSPVTTDLKAWTTLRARACRVGIPLYRSDPRDGPPAFFSVRFGVARMHASLEHLEEFIGELERQRRLEVS